MEAAERIFSGEFSCVTDDGDDVRMAPVTPVGPMSPSQTPCASARASLPCSLFSIDVPQTPEHADGEEDLDMRDNEDDGGFLVTLSQCTLISHPLVDDYIDYDSDYEAKRNTGEVDPYAGKLSILSCVIWQLSISRHLLLQGSSRGSY